MTKKKKNLITAAELVDNLRRDPEWTKRQERDERARDALRAEFEAAEQPVLNDLKKIGVSVPTLGNAVLFEPYLPLSGHAVNILLRWLPSVHWRLKEPIVRLLAAPAHRYDGKLLANLFDGTLAHDLDEENNLHMAVSIADLRWAIANTIAEARPYGISDWVLNKVSSSSLGKSKEMLFIAAARLCPADKVIPLLWQSFDEFPAHCAIAVSEVGDEADLDTLRKKRNAYAGSSRKQIDKTIRAMEERLG